MRFSEGTTKGRFVDITNPDKFEQNEEVIVFTREEFSWVYRSMINQVNYVNDIALKLDPTETWKLMSYWPKIMERVHILDKNMNMLLAERPQQTYLDAFLYDAPTVVKTKPVTIKEKVPIQQTFPF
ncbi:MAG: hypothetical protein NKF70_11120 [Methanobacterium sp. ERen5]|nr:MAG: hypothetical protein NKF70_11120 [Methanobacterium sp. ERen5]